MPPAAHHSERKKLVGRRRLKSTGSSGSSSVISDDLSVLRNYVPGCLDQYGFCVIDGFIGETRGHLISDEVRALYDSGAFEDGLLTSQAHLQTAVRGDRVYWLERETADQFVNVRKLLTLCDNMFLLLRGHLGPYNITSRTKAMLACYPGEGRGYRRHVDNPNQDGRCITCIYYLNDNWQAKTDGGVLRISPTRLADQTIDLEPQLDRLLLFWSDHRTPHEVMPANRNRYAVTVWYFDDSQRQQARVRYAQHRGSSDDNSQLAPVDLRSP
jgi:hypoxia-inducible factor (prolyl hydroxylase)